MKARATFQNGDVQYFEAHWEDEGQRLVLDESIRSNADNRLVGLEISHPVYGVVFMETGGIHGNSQESSL